MNKEVVLHHHLGLGDHFVCNGLVHQVATTYDKIHLPAKLHNFNTVQCLYQDWDNITVFPVAVEHRDVIDYCNTKKLPVLRVGFEYLDTCELECNICFYEQLNLDFSIRYSNFKLPSHIPNSDKLYETLVHTKKDYVLLHQQSSIGKFFVDIKSKLPVIEIRPGLTENLLDYVKIIQNASEIHCIDSSVINLIDGMTHKTDKLFFHTIKPTSFKFSDKWNIVKYTKS